jgi:hypothetical protein
MSDPRTIAVLCAQRRSVYHRMLGVDVYDIDRDARTFPGGMPVIAHPPCRAWSKHCAHQAKPDPGEKELGIWCAQQVKKWGGILEQPAGSRLWHATGLPDPGEHLAGWSLWSESVWRAWWGYSMRKATWLLFSQIDPSHVKWPLVLHNPGLDRRREQVMSKNQRSKTAPAMAEWLVATARQAKT